MQLHKTFLPSKFHRFKKLFNLSIKKLVILKHISRTETVLKNLYNPLKTLQFRRRRITQEEQNVIKMRINSTTRPSSKTSRKTDKSNQIPTRQTTLSQIIQLLLNLIKNRNHSHLLLVNPGIKVSPGSRKVMTSF